MNECKIEGTLIRVKKGVSQKGNKWAFFTVKANVGETTGGEPISSYLQFKAFGDVVDAFEGIDTDSEKPTIRVKGKIRSEAKKDNKDFVMDTRGYKVYETFIQADVIKVGAKLTDAKPQTSEAPF